MDSDHGYVVGPESPWTWANLVTMVRVMSCLVIFGHAMRTGDETEVELDVLRRHRDGFRPQRLTDTGIKPVVDAKGLAELQTEVAAVQVEDKILDYIYAIVAATRHSNDLIVGGSPRAGIALLNCGKAIAALRGREFVIPDDVKQLALAVLRHRVILRPEAEVEGLTADRILTSLIEAQTVPR